MEGVVPVLNDIVIVFFDLLYFMNMVTLKKHDNFHRNILFFGCLVITLMYFVATYMWKVPPSMSALCFVALPSMLWFYGFSKYKDCRFFLTFFVVDTIILAIGFVIRWIDDFTSNRIEIFIFILTILVFASLYWGAKPYFVRYRELLKVQTGDWLGMTIVSGIIYAGMIFMAAYPYPLVLRFEYAPSYLVLCLIVLSCYYVFIQSLMKTKVIYQQNEKLLKEQKYHRIAYMDVLTGLNNRASYMECVEEMERNPGLKETSSMIVFDLNGFKKINDHYGHHAGDKVLQFFGNVLKTIFFESYFKIFRMGGDEFLVIAVKMNSIQLEEYVQKVDEYLKQEEDLHFSLSVAHGISFYDSNRNETMEDVFERADKAMYMAKKSER